MRYCVIYYHIAFEDALELKLMLNFY